MCIRDRYQIQFNQMNFISTKNKCRSPEKEKRLNYILQKVSGGQAIISEQFQKDFLFLNSKHNAYLLLDKIAKKQNNVKCMQEEEMDQRDQETCSQSMENYLKQLQSKRKLGPYQQKIYSQKKIQLFKYLKQNNEMFIKENYIQPKQRFKSIDNDNRIASVIMYKQSINNSKQNLQHQNGEKTKSLRRQSLIKMQESLQYCQEQSRQKLISEKTNFRSRVLWKLFNNSQEQKTNETQLQDAIPMRKILKKESFNTFFARANASQKKALIKMIIEKNQKRFRLSLIHI
eukprot:TRINITY_DN581_c0_g1_i5.p1 TRINITY_DN581_c0_g1~~TRINITY_DN581_c0_g1_i5.p1  ORF type:complete len:334 (-),score=46.98 TRINITY_DN581_c0_g1_i5:3-863(-)